MDFGFIHIRKAGGTAFKHLIRSALKDADEETSPIRLFEHPVTLEKMWSTHPRRHAIFIVRDPVERFISGFEGRQRKGLPRFHTPWNDEEREAFRLFQSANDLAEALSSKNKWERGAARFAMLGIRHTRDPLTYWLHSRDYLMQNNDRIAFVGYLPEINLSLGELLDALGLPYDLKFPTDTYDANRNPKPLKPLSERGRRNIEAWYAEDYRIMEWCLNKWRGYYV